MQQYYIVRTLLPYKKSPGFVACIATPTDDFKASRTPFSPAYPNLINMTSVLRYHI